MASQIGVGAPPGVEPSIDPNLARLERDATLWGDVWKKLRRDKRFILAATLIVIFALMGVALKSAATRTICERSSFTMGCA